MTGPGQAVVVPSSAGRAIAFGSAPARITVKASEAETGGLCSVWEGQVAPGTVGASSHYHLGRDEMFYVLKGELVLQIGDVHHIAPAGSFAFVPRGTVHGFRNDADVDATLLVVHHPAGFERYFDELKELVARNAGREERAALAARYDVIPVANPDSRG